MRQISIAIPTFERADMTIRSFKDIHDDERVAEIVISDDGSYLPEYMRLVEMCKEYSKVKLRRNELNCDCYENKYIALANCTSDFVVLFDSDNIISKDYLDKIYELEWDEATIYLPAFAAPLFDYRAFNGLTIDKSNVNEYFGKPMFATMLNTMNFFVNRKVYIEAFDPFENPYTADSIYMNYRFLEMGCKLYVVPDLTYQHTVHEGSHYKLNNHKTGNFYNEVEELIKQLK